MCSTPLPPRPITRNKLYKDDFALVSLFLHVLCDLLCIQPGVSDGGGGGGVRGTARDTHLLLSQALQGNYVVHEAAAGRIGGAEDGGK